MTVTCVDATAAAIAVIAKTVEFVPAASAAISATPSIKTHAVSNFPKFVLDSDTNLHARDDRHQA